MLIEMSNKHMNEAETANLVFADPVEYLAQFGIEAELVTQTTLPAAA